MTADVRDVTSENGACSRFPHESRLSSLRRCRCAHAFRPRALILSATAEIILSFSYISKFCIIAQCDKVLFCIYGQFSILARCHKENTMRTCFTETKVQFTVDAKARIKEIRSSRGEFEKMIDWGNSRVSSRVMEIARARLSTNGYLSPFLLFFSSFSSDSILYSLRREPHTPPRTLSPWPLLRNPHLSSGS